MKIAVINLLADTGHVVPLLKIAHNLKEKDVTLKYFGAHEIQGIVKDYKVDYENLGAIKPLGYEKILARFSNAGFYVRELFLMEWFVLKYCDKITFNGSEKFTHLKESISSFAPDAILCDGHNFLDQYKKIAKDLNLPLVVNFSAGSNYIYSIEKYSLEMGMKKFNFMLNKFHRALTWIFDSKIYKEESLIKKSLKSYWDWLCHEDLHKVQTLNLSMGLGALENIYLADRIEVREDFIQLGPQAIDNSLFEISHELSTWLDDESLPPVIFISFGTMVKGSFDFSSKILKAAESLGFRVLWAHPEMPWPKHFSDESPHRWERWVPQVKILSHARVKLFINHAGSGACQESIWFSKPSICLPFMWDQPYNAWVMEQLNCAVVIDIHKIEQKKMAHKIQEALGLNAQTKKISDEFRKMESSQQVFDLIKKYVAAFKENQ